MLLHIIYASTSGHTEYVVERICSTLGNKAPDVQVRRIRAEQATADDLTKGDAMLLASGTWNTGGPEGQLNPHMHGLLLDRAKNVDLKKKPVAMVALGDERYRYTAKAGDHLQLFVESHNGTLLGERLTIVNEPYEQDGKIADWAGDLLTALQKL